MRGGLWNKLTGLMFPRTVAPSTANQADEWVSKSMDLSSQGRGPEAVAAAAKAAELAPKDLIARLNYADVLIGQGLLDRAKAILADLRKSFPGSPEVYSASGICARAAGEYVAALEFVDQAIAIRPREHLDWAVRGWICLNLHRYDDAVRDSSRALGMDSGNLMARNTLARALCRLHRYSEAAAEAEKLLRDNLTRPSGLLVLGVVARSRYQPDEALAKFREISQEPKWAWEVADDVLHVLLDYGRWAEAEAHVAEIASRGAPAELLARLNAAILASDCRWDDALAVLTGLQSGPPTAKRVDLDRAKILAVKGECKDALGVLKGLSPDLKSEGVLTVELCLQLGHVGDARAGVEHILALSPSLPDGLHKAVQIDWLEGKFEQAVAHAHLLTQKAPEDEHGHFQLLTSLAATGMVRDMDSALADAVRNLKAPDDCALLRGVVAAAKGDAKGALVEYDSALRLTRESSAGAMGLRQHLWELGVAQCHALRAAVAPDSAQDRADSLHHLGRAFDKGFWQKRLVWSWPSFRALRGDGQFAAMCGMA